MPPKSTFKPGETKETQLLTWLLEEMKVANEQARCCCGELKEELRHVIHELHVISKKIDQLLPEPADTVDRIAIVFGGSMPATPGTVAVGSTVVASIVPLEADGVTVTPGAVLSAQGYTVDNPSVASFVTNPDGTATFTGVSSGTATVTATATVTDLSGIANGFTATNTLVVTGPSTGVSAGIQINFAAPLTPSIKK